MGRRFTGPAEVFGGTPGVVRDAVVDADALGAGEGFLRGEFAMCGGFEGAHAVVASELSQLLREFPRACEVWRQRGSRGHGGAERLAQVECSAECFGGSVGGVISRCGSTHGGVACGADEPRDVIEGVQGGEEASLLGFADGSVGERGEEAFDFVGGVGDTSEVAVDAGVGRGGKGIGGAGTGDAVGVTERATGGLDGDGRDGLDGLIEVAGEVGAAVADEA